jgi:HEPN domain-containing protein
MSKQPTKTEMSFFLFSHEADLDYLLARMVSFLGGGFHGRAGYLGAQAFEKYLKALSVQHDGGYLETHKLLDLAEAIEPHYSFLNEQECKDDLAAFDMFDQVGRYGAAAKFDPLSQGRNVAGQQLVAGAGVQIAGARAWTPQHLHRLDRFVFNARRHLNYSTAGIADGLVCILAGDQTHILTALWKGPVGLKEVLTRDNTYFTAQEPA